MTDPATRIENMRERIWESDDISDADRDVLLEFSDEPSFIQQQYSDHRHLKLLSHCTNMAEKVGGLADALEIATPRGTRPLDQPHPRHRRDDPRLPGRASRLRPSRHRRRRR